ncbi:MAG: tetratricopeptide repeat protein [Patescibacteria group bacterium]
MRLSNHLDSLCFSILAILVFLTPLFFLPITFEFYEFNKQALLMSGALLLIILWSSSMLAAHQVKLVRTPFGMPLFLFLGSWLISTIFASPNRANALFDPGQAGTILALTLIYLVATNIVTTKKQLDILFFSLASSLALLAIITLFWGSGLITSFISVSYLKSNFWSPAGSSLTALIALSSLIPTLILFLFKNRAGSPKSLLILATLLLTLGSVSLLTYRLFGSNTARPPLLSISTSWAIALEAIKASPVFGTGPGTYLASFAQYKPLSYNLTPYWSVRFSKANNYLLEIAVTLGLLGVLSYLFLVARVTSVLTKVFHTFSESPQKIHALGFGLSVLLLFASQLFFPTPLLTLYLIFICLTLISLSLKVMGSNLVHEASIDIVTSIESGHKSAILPGIFLILSLLFALPSAYALTNVYRADVYFQKSIVAANANDAKTTYNNLEKAYRTNPFQDSYRIAYSQTNLLLANSIASAKEVTESDQTTIAQLVQQAIREAKNAVALNPKKITTAENLATVYRSLISSAKDADSWTITSYSQAIRLDPANPNLRIAIGGVYHSLKKFDEAAKYFQQAIDLKPDLPNAHYNLAATYKERKDYAKAVTAMQQVVNLVDPASADYTKASSELEVLQKLAGPKDTDPALPTQPATSQLETPLLLPSPKITPIQLPAELGPEPTVTPHPTPAQ